MKLFIDLSEPFVGYVSVDLRRAYVAMPQHHLNGPEVCTVLEKMSCEAMSEQVRSDVPYACPFAIRDDGFPKRLPGEGLPFIC